MSHTYEFPRDFGDTIHSNPDTFNISHIGEPEPIACRISEAILANPFKVDCDGLVLKVTFVNELTAAQQTALADCVDTQKALDDWPPIEA